MTHRRSPRHPSLRTERVGQQPWLRRRSNVGRRIVRRAATVEVVAYQAELPGSA